MITFADALQVEHLGAGALAATATGGLNVFALVILPMGTVFIVQSFVAQLVGAGDRDGDAALRLVRAHDRRDRRGDRGSRLIPAIDPLLALDRATRPRSASR